MYDPRTILLVAGLIVAVVLILFLPGRGLLPRWRQDRRLTRRVLSEDALKHIYKCEMGDRAPMQQGPLLHWAPSVASIAGTLHISLNETAELLTQMEADGLIQSKQGEILLTDAGREAALHIIRAHRLWERYLAEETGFAEQAWHERAERWEHSLSPADADALSAQLGHPHYDPHGDPIPTADGELREHGGEPLPRLLVGSLARIVHLEDEPEIVYAQLLAEGLHLGQIVRVTESTADRLRFWANGDEHVLAPIVANNISVRAIERRAEMDEEPGDSLRLSSLKPGETAEVIAISPVSRGAERRRLLDLGILPGTSITAEFDSPSGDPVAYRIRGAVIALRYSQAEQVKVKRLEVEA